MVNGTENFERHFRKFKEQYTVIGGFACDLLMNDAGLDFRQTADIDMVLIVEALTSEFAEAFWKFIEAGGYQARQRSSGKPEFYRFVNPTNTDYPKMIELFSRPQSHVVLKPDAHLLPLHIDDEISSLSAILLNDDYYNLLLEGRTVVNGISVMEAAYLIPFKMKAWIDLEDKRSQGVHVNSRDIRKHRLDVFRLYRLVRSGQKVLVPKAVYEDIQLFISRMRTVEIRLEDIGIYEPKDRILDMYEEIYVVKI